MYFVFFIVGVAVGMFGCYLRGAIARWEDEHDGTNNDEE